MSNIKSCLKKLKLKNNYEKIIYTWNTLNARLARKSLAERSPPQGLNSKPVFSLKLFLFKIIIVNFLLWI